MNKRPSEKAYKDRLWATFRAASTQIRLNSQLDEVIKTETGLEDLECLDDYSTMYTEALTAEDCNLLKEKLRQASPANFSSYPQ